MDKRSFFQAPLARVSVGQRLLTAGFPRALLSAAVLLLPLSGCVTHTGQGFKEKIHRTEYSVPDENDDQYVTAEESSYVKMKDGVWVPPFKSEGDIRHDLIYEQTEKGWYLGMGSADTLKGGDIAGALAEMSNLISEFRRLVEQWNPAVSGTRALLEPLVAPDGDP